MTKELDVAMSCYVIECKMHQVSRLNDIRITKITSSHSHWMTLDVQQIKNSDRDLSRTKKNKIGPNNLREPPIQS